MRLVLATYNIRRGGHHRAERIAAVLVPFEPDIVVLQEAIEPAIVERIARELGLPAVTSRRGASVAALSRTQLADARWHADGPGHGFLELRPVSPAVRIIGVHLTAGLSMRGESRRLRQTERLLRLAADEDAPPTALVGDFNAVAPGDGPFVRTMPLWIRALLRFDGGIQTAAMASVHQAGFVDAFRQCHPNGPGGTLPAAAPSVRLDYVMLDRTLAAGLISCRVPTADATAALASDHLPVIAELELPEAG
jgi:endonuclease/exonuclease/phosphatase family metal-dependent hydrolase